MTLLSTEHRREVHKCDRDNIKKVQPFFFETVDPIPEEDIGKDAILLLFFLSVWLFSGTMC